MKKLVLLFLAGCATAPYSTHAVVVNDPALAEDVARAVTELNEHVPPGTFTLETNGTVHVGYVEVFRDNNPERFFPSLDGVVAYTEFDGSIVSVGVSDRARYVAIAHELGHAAGLAHVDDPKNLMYYRPAWWNLTPEQIKTIRAAH